ncbi:hypothetical protein ACQP1W_26935 [Spirillospora sp. CA-255316]
MPMAAARLAGALAIGGALLAFGGCGAIADIARNPCEKISHELASLEEKSHGASQYSAGHAQSFRDAAAKIRSAAKEIDGSTTHPDPQPGRSTANEIAGELEVMATKLSKLPPGERAVYVSRGSKPESLPHTLQDSCGIPTDSG